MDKPEIKPCPFCGAKLLGTDQRNVFAHPISVGCFLDGRYVSDIKAWNTRVPKEEIIRCKDCKHRHSSEFCECRPEDAYCSDGERMIEND